MKDEFFKEVLSALYQAQEEGYDVRIGYEGIEGRITSRIDAVHVQSETFETYSELLPKGDVNKITFLQRAIADQNCDMNQIRVKHILETSITELRKKTDMGLGSEKYIEFVVYDKKGIVSDGSVKDMDESVLERKVERWDVEPDPQDTDVLIVRIYV